MPERGPVRDRNVLGDSPDLRSELSSAVGVRVPARQLLDAIDTLIVVLDAQGRILLINRACEQASGRGNAEVVGRMFWEAMAPAAPPEQAVALRAVFQRLGGSVAEIRHTCSLDAKGGEPLSIAWAFASVAGEGAKRPRHVIVTGTDVTERRRAEEESRAVEDRTRLALDAVKDYAIFMLDVNGDVSDWNAGAQRLYGYRPQEILGKHVSIFFTPEDVALGLPAAGLAAAQAKGQVESQGWRVRKDGSRFWADVARAAVRDRAGGMIGYVGVTRDVTEVRRAQAALRRSAAELEDAHRELLFQKSALDEHAIVAVTDGSGRINYVNDKFCQISKYSREELIGQDHRILNSGYHPQAFFTDMYAHIANGKVWRGEIRNRAKDGSIYWVDTTIVPFRDPAAGTITRYVAIRADITARKRAEEALAARVRRQATLASLGQHAVEIDDVQELVEEAAAQLSVALDVELVDLLELSDDRASLVLRAGVGWPARMVGRVVSDASTATPAGLALLSNEPVVVRDFRSEARFPKSSFARRAGAISGITVAVAGRSIHGALEVFSKRPREFAQDDVHFMRSIANLLASAVHIRRAELARRDIESRQRAIVNSAVDGIIVIDERGRIESANPAAERLFGRAAAELVGQNVNVLMPEPYRHEHDGYIANYLRTRVPKIIGVGREVVGLRKDGTTFPMDLSVSEFLLGDRRMFAGVVHDITQRRKLEREILEISGNEQRRIGQDLHDGLCQQLTAVSFASESLAKRLARSAPGEVPYLRKIAGLVDETLTQARDLARGLNPVDIDAGGLVAALEDLCAKISERFAVTCRLRTAGTIAVRENSVATHLYRIAQEASSNAIRHGKAKRVEIVLECVGDRLTLSIHDNGSGIGHRIPGRRPGVGMQIMNYRAHLVGASFSVRPGRRRGTVVTCALRCALPASERNSNANEKAAKADQAATHAGRTTRAGQGRRPRQAKAPHR